MSPAYSLAEYEHDPWGGSVSISQICLAWLLAQELNLFPLVAPSTEIHIQEAAASVDLHLTKEECRWLYEG